MVSELQPGSPIPNPVVADQDGVEQALRERLGPNGAVIYFYPKDATPGCTTEAQDFQAALSTLKARGVAVIGVSRDSVKSHANFRATQGLTFPLLSDGDGTLSEAFGVWQEKKVCGRTCMGLVRTTFLVDGAGLVKKVYANVKVKGHVQQVLADLET
ncbi:MAG: peroxiredoxin [Magnetococcales bacterium]|nr:peroxiredoxin [Magnetococcales bacterium]